MKLDATPAAAPGAAAAAALARWPLDAVLASGRTDVIEDLIDRFGPLRCGIWPEPPARAVIVPMARPGQPRPAGFVIAGISPRLVFTDEYKGFVELLAGHVATAIGNARAYEEERRRAEALAQLDRAKTAFFSNVSHEFRTPLTLMLGPVQDLLAERPGELPPAATEQLEVVNRNGRRLLRLVNTLLDFSRIEAGRVRALYQPTDLAAFTADLASVFRAAVERAGLRLQVDCPPLPEPVVVDREMWEKVVLNLLSNAFKFTFEGEIVVSLARAGAFAELRVADTGTGIAADEMARLFERFHRIRNARTRTHEGSGIGLALVQDLVRLHGGSVGAESVPGRGTTFTVRVPLGHAHLDPAQIGAGAPATAANRGSAAPFVEEALRWLPEDASADAAIKLRLDGDEASAAEAVDEDALPWHDTLPSSVAADSEGGDARAEPPLVLVADDNADMRQYVSRLLAGAFRVRAVPDGRAALAAAREELPDLVLSDVMMPGLDGFGLLRELRADARTAGCPVILLSARAGEEARIEGAAAGADDYLVKPFSARELLARVTAQVQMGRLRRAANEALRASEERFRQMANTAPAMIWSADAAGTITFHNQRWLDYAGLTPEANSRDWPRRVLHPDDIERCTAAWAAALASGSDYEIEVRNRRHDGEYRWFLTRATAVRDSGGRIVEWLGSTTDIHERKLAEERQAFALALADALRPLADPLEAQQQAMRLLGEKLQAARAYYYTVERDEAGYVNVVETDYYHRPEMPSLVGRYPQRAFGAAWYEHLASGEVLVVDNVSAVLGPEDWARYRAIDIHAFMAVPLIKGGQYIGGVAVVQSRPRHWREGEVAIVEATAERTWDAMERAGLAQALRRQAEQLKESDRRKDEFLATLAHELRNPLAPLRNGLEVLRLRDADASARAQTLGIMRRQLAQMVRLVDDLLDVSRVSRGQLQLKRERVTLAGVIDAAVETSRPLLSERGHQLSVALPDEPLLLDADATRLAQVFSNLLNNAARYTPNGGRIHIAAARESSQGGHRVDGGGDGSGAGADQAVVRISDNGSGIPPHMLGRIFELFTQVDVSLERAQGGLGIGLTLVRRLVEMHGGSVEAKSDGLGKGSEFIVRLPLAASARALAAVARQGGTAAAPRWRILVADDNADSASSSAALLSLLGHDVRTASDGLLALQAAAEFRPDVLLLDISMPGLNGYEVTTRIRREPWGRAMAIVALTGYGRPEDQRLALEAGCDLHRVKPVDYPALLEALARRVGPRA
ncbi:MAG: ATP-binding protein [Rubrivivax sp.]